MADVDVLIVGAGITGIYQLYRAREAGFSAVLLEAGAGVGGTWFWNRYPGARFDSESYTYGYLFSRELFDEWEWSEHFAGQPEIERYLNHVVDRFDLRRAMEFGTRVTAAVWSGDHWAVSADDGRGWDARFLVAATGVLSVPYFPDVPGRDAFAGEQYHTGLWPSEPVDFRDQRVAVVGTGSSGVQIVPVIAEEAASLTVYQRSANWCTPLNNAPIRPDEQRALRAEFDALCHVLNTSAAGFLHQPHDRGAFDDSDEERLAFFEKMWHSPGFAKLSSNYLDLLFNDAANDAWCAFLEGKIRSIVRDPVTADKLIPTHRYGQKRPPFVNGYYEAFNRDNVTLVDLRASPIVFDDLDIVVWATGFDFGTGALARMGVVGRDGVALNDHWADGPQTFLGVCTAGFPNLFFPGGPHAAAGNNPRYNGDQVDFVTDTLIHTGDRVIEVTAEAEQRWTDMVDRAAQTNPFGELGQYFGTNIPGKPRRYLLNAGGRPKLFKEIARVKDTDYAAFTLL
ncbi:MAG TPA: NAD(P)/FAD-dependent oxidoreductase [Acidimicrobiales bacterium]|nr:NAD(P)/FAD-dependent oxidoreductase [Acidimicrobiales bacterium]